MHKVKIFRGNEKTLQTQIDEWTKAEKKVGPASFKIGDVAASPIDNGGSHLVVITYKNCS